jgi:3-methylfumaryl-CoA hydratase
MTALANWVGRKETLFDTVTAAHVAKFCAMLNRPVPHTGQCPQSIHWTLCPVAIATADLRGDGHPAPAETGLVPHGAPARRMWASSSVEFFESIYIGDAIERRSIVVSVTEKQGRTGALVFVDVDHLWLANDAVAVKERQTIVYREDGPSGGQGTTTENQTSADFASEMIPEAALLFRYSALTFNSHRIHYDLPFARDVEGYPDLVVQGPLMATLLIDLVNHHTLGNMLASFQFRGVAPAFVSRPLQISARRSGAAGDLMLSAASEGRQVMQASGTLAKRP